MGAYETGRFSARHHWINIQTIGRTLRKLYFHFPWGPSQVPPQSPQYDSAVMYGGFQGGPQLGPPDAERLQSLGQL